VPTELMRGRTEVLADVDCAGRHCAAVLSTTPFYDPRGVRLRS
jgi:hypothetical protein